MDIIDPCGNKGMLSVVIRECTECGNKGMLIATPCGNKHFEKGNQNILSTFIFLYNIQFINNYLPTICPKNDET